MSAPETLFFRADASRAIGTGHVLRCLALAEEQIARGGGVVFLFADSLPTLEERLRSSGCHIARITAKAGSIDDAEETLGHMQGHGIVVVDGYNFESEYQKHLKRGGCRILFIDDYGHATPYVADVICNQNSYAQEQADLYRERPKETQLLLGTEYALLRSEFLRFPQKPKECPTLARRILVTMGGSDPENATLRMLRALAMTEISSFHVTVILGGGNPHRESIAAWGASASLAIDIVVDARDMPRRMADADLAIAAGGSTCWELLFMGLPFITGILAENQVAIAEDLGKKSLARNMGWYRDASEQELVRAVRSLAESQGERVRLAEHGRSIVDGRGAQRVLDVVQSFSS